MFTIMGMYPVSYYDLSQAGVPVHSTAFRPIDDASLARNPFRVFTSLLRLELIENEILRQHHTVFLMQIGGKLKSGKPHDGRAPDYDDWDLNGDILMWNPVLQCAFEISSMGIRVEESSLDRQLTRAGCDDRRSLPVHKMLLNGELPLTMGGGIGQSRLCMLMIGACHIGEVQSSIWDRATTDACRDAGILLL